MAKTSTVRRRTALDRALIVDRAVEIVDQEGLDSLTMRRLAQELEVGVMTLYGYFANKDEILDAMADAIMGSYRIPSGVPARARETFIAVTGSLAELFYEHPSVARLLTMRVTNSPDSLDGAMEQVLDRFITVGMTPAHAVRAYGAMMHYALGTVLYQLPRPWGAETEEAMGMRQDRVAFYDSLDPARFPRLRELAHELPTLPGGRQFASGLEALADGLFGRD